MSSKFNKKKMFFKFLELKESTALILNTSDIIIVSSTLLKGLIREYQLVKRKENSLNYELQKWKSSLNR